VGSPAILAQAVSTGGPLATGGACARSTAVTTNGQNNYEFTGLPAWPKKIKLVLRNVSVTGGSNAWFRVQLGTSGGYVGSGYNSTVASVTNNAYPTTGFDNIGFMPAFSVADSDTFSGVIDLAEIDTNVWVMSTSLKASTGRLCFSSGDVSLGGELTSVKLSVHSSGTFDGGTINLIYE